MIQSGQKTGQIIQETASFGQTNWLGNPIGCRPVWKRRS